MKREPIEKIPLNKLKIGDKISGGRISHYWATVEKIESDGITICYNGTVKSIKFAPKFYNQIGVII
jgi:hypothetical protein